MMQYIAGILLGIMIVFWLFVLVWLISKIKMIRLPKTVILGLTGAPGTGKTFNSVKQALKHHIKMTILYYLHFVFRRLPLPKEKPILYSNIPIWYKAIPIIGKRKKARKLTFKHILGLQYMPEYSTILLTELGEIANQYQFKNPIVMIYLQRLFRLGRHWGDWFITWDDQMSDNVVKPLRGRTGAIYNLVNFKRWFIFFYKVNVQRVMITEDVTTVEQTTEYEELPYLFGRLPFKFFTFLNKIFFFMPMKHYDSRCYSKTYRPIYDVDGNKIVYEDESIFLDMDWDDELKTNYFLHLPHITKELEKDYREHGHISYEKALFYIEEYEKTLAEDQQFLIQRNRKLYEEQAQKRNSTQQTQETNDLE